MSKSENKYGEGCIREQIQLKAHIYCGWFLTATEPLHCCVAIINQRERIGGAHPLAFGHLLGKWMGGLGNPLVGGWVDLSQIYHTFIDVPFQYEQYSSSCVFARWRPPPPRGFRDAIPFTMQRTRLCRPSETVRASDNISADVKQPLPSSQQQSCWCNWGKQN